VFAAEQQLTRLGFGDLPIISSLKSRWTSSSETTQAVRRRVEEPFAMS
jgi:hypothetical protein